jgi:hypothetical protein
MAYDPERVAEQKIDDDEIGKAQQRMADEQGRQRSQQAMGSTATRMAEAQTPSAAEEEEESMSM